MMGGHVDYILAAVSLIHALAALGGVFVSIMPTIRTRRPGLLLIRVLRLAIGLMYTYTGTIYGLMFLGVHPVQFGGVHTLAMLLFSVMGSFYVLFVGLNIRDE